MNAHKFNLEVFLQEEKSIDPFVLYEQGYKDMRHAINSVLCIKETAELLTCMQVSINFVHFVLV